MYIYIDIHIVYIKHWIHNIYTQCKALTQFWKGIQKQITCTSDGSLCQCWCRLLLDLSCAKNGSFSFSLVPSSFKSPLLLDLNHWLLLMLTESGLFDEQSMTRDCSRINFCDTFKLAALVAAVLSAAVFVVVWSSNAVFVVDMGRGMEVVVSQLSLVRRRSRIWSRRWTKKSSTPSKPAGKTEMSMSVSSQTNQLRHVYTNQSVPFKSFRSISPYLFRSATQTHHLFQFLHKSPVSQPHLIPIFNLQKSYLYPSLLLRPNITTEVLHFSGVKMILLLNHPYLI